MHCWLRQPSSSYMSVRPDIICKPSLTRGLLLNIDLHLESPKAYNVYQVRPVAPYLALLGDIGYTKHQELFGFLRTQLRQFQLVFFVLGNHEPYKSSWKQAVCDMEDFERETATQPDGLGRFVFLNQTRYDVSDTLTILGCTLFSHVSEEQKEDVSFGLNDFYRIDQWTVESHNTQHEADLAWLEEQISAIQRSEPDRQVVVLSHHSPTIDARTINPSHANSKISSGFMTNLSNAICWQSPSVSVWAFGHSHFNCDYFDVTGKRVVTNQRGYYFAQAQGFEECKVLII